MRPDKVLFLDIDGVLRSKAYELYAEGKRISDAELFCPICCSNFNFLMSRLSGFEIIISSGWRTGYSIQQLERILHKNGIIQRVYDVTPQLNSSRHIEITKWLDVNYADGWPEVVIIDDEADFGNLSEFHYRTDADIGFTLPMARNILHYSGRYSSASS
jgi:hypothetical protein